MIPWMQITSVADAVVTIPAAATIAAWLIVGRAWHMAALWCVLFISGLGIVVATKIAFIAWGVGISAIDFMGMSGHAMRAMAVFPVILYLILLKSPARIRTSGVVFGIFIGLLVSVSRLALNVHSPSEVITGAALGGAVSMGFIWVSRTLTEPSLSRSIIALGLCVLLPTSYASPAPTNQWMNAVASYLSGHEGLYERHIRRAISPDEHHAR